MQNGEDPGSRREEKIGKGGRIRWKDEKKENLLGVCVGVWGWVVLHGVDE
jgi:hypothetical protein